ncbi:antibiotic biosynthesis monooxygenase family protein [Rhizobium sp. NRK18]|uniref:antibiotic biosynthesis monooxygenase family protein n=1 Tax=Rhizobium sp. NRK18 TaxID=2964667 RepID=UPI0021C4441F|nr:antibiotic biosynthesis monooxygenase [Rhizobium sp. NRK18]MCQ2004622.1 antibiotic biosynthesis monooxygenase [Rhizobium sp. NRK18]
MTKLAKTPPPPYYVVIFSTLRTDGDHGYAAMAEKMDALAAEQPGYLGIDSVRDASGFGITNSYWRDEESVLAWKRNAEHTLARDLGREKWYQCYELRVARVERAYGFERK